MISKKLLEEKDDEKTDIEKLSNIVQSFHDM